MNVYDFDKTIYDGDCATNFFLIQLKRQPSLMRIFIPLGWSYLLYKLGLRSRTKMKESLYAYVKYVDHIEEKVLEFWKVEKHKIKEWYLQQRRADDVIISASPEFLIGPICEELGVEWMGSRLDIHTGKYDGLNCYGEEKVVRYREVYKDETIHEFYSDHISDAPLARIAKKAYFVKKDQRLPWPESSLNQNKEEEK